MYIGHYVQGENMLNKNCSRCNAFTSVLEKGRKFNEDFLCENCLMKAIENNEIEKPNNNDEHSAITILNFLNKLYLFYSILASIFSASIINSSPFNVSIQTTGPIIVIGGIIKSFFIYYVVKILNLIVDTLLKINKKIK